MPQFRTRPIVIEAVQFWPERRPWPQGVQVVEHVLVSGVEHLVMVPMVDTLEGKSRVSPGDWIITGVQGERYPIKDSIFRETYDAVD